MVSSLLRRIDITKSGGFRTYAMTVADAPVPAFVV